jgi:LmbE family N-acetylglucosaminyl deacetylase
VVSTLIVAPHVFMTESADDVRLTAGGPVPYKGELRVAEMRSVAAAMGFKHTRLQYPVHRLDGESTAELIKQLDCCLDSSVEMLLIPGPSHDADHEATRRACEALCRPHRFAGTVMEYFTWGTPAPYENAVYVPLTEDELELKIKAMEMYQTQISAGGESDDLYPYSPSSIALFAAEAGRMIHTEWAEPYTGKRLVVR